MCNKTEALHILKEAYERFSNMFPNQVTAGNNFVTNDRLKFHSK